MESARSTPLNSSSSSGSTEAVPRGNWILHARAKRHFWQGIGALSIKTFRGGKAIYNVGRGCVTADPNGYLLLNDGEHYSVEIDSKNPVESFCLFFKPGLAEDIALNHRTKQELLLDNPDPTATTRLHFFQHSHIHDQTLSPRISRLQDALARNRREPGWIEEQFHAIAEALIEVHHRDLRRADSIPAVRPSTREELYRRVHRARDFVETMYAEPLTLDQLAGVACLSPNHFLRTFRQIFGVTPHQYLTGKRLSAACRLLSGTEKSVTEICMDTGFQSLGSFSWLFRRRFGSSPEQYRKKVIFEK